MSTLWHLSPTVLTSEDRFWHYGSGNFRFHVPGIDCPRCGPGGGGNAKLHQIECPEVIRKEVEALQSDSPCLAPVHFAHVKHRWEQGLRRSGSDQEINPGDSFLPFDWKIPTVPRYSIFWLSFAAILGEDLATRLRNGAVAGIALLHVVLQRAGSLEVDTQIPEALFGQCNEPEDILDLVPALPNPERLGQFSYLFVLDNSLNTWKREIDGEVSVCTICGRATVPRRLEIERNKACSYYRRRNELPIRYCFNSDVFRSHIYDDGFVVSSRVLELIQECDLRNCNVRQLRVVPD